MEIVRDMRNTSQRYEKIQLYMLLRINDESKKKHAKVDIVVEEKNIFHEKKDVKIFIRDFRNFFKICKIRHRDMKNFSNIL